MSDWNKLPEWQYLDSPSEPDIVLLCGSTAEFDVASGMGYRCHTCMAMVGSIGMPRQCKTLYDMEDVIQKLKGTK